MLEAWILEWMDQAGRRRRAEQNEGGKIAGRLNHTYGSFSLDASSTPGHSFDGELVPSCCTPWGSLQQV